jgi:glutathione S-transferase
MIVVYHLNNSRSQRVLWLLEYEIRRYQRDPKNSPRPDIQMSFPLEAASARVGPDASRPRLAAFLDRVHARPAYQRAFERGGEFTLLS